LNYIKPQKAKMMCCPSQGYEEPYEIFIAGKNFSVTECGDYSLKDQWRRESEEYRRRLHQNTERNVK